MNNTFIKYNGQRRDRERNPDGIRLPFEYVRCSYIVPQTSFASYIDTGLKADYNDEYIITCRRWSGEMPRFSAISDKLKSVKPFCRIISSARSA